MNAPKSYESAKKTLTASTWRALQLVHVNAKSVFIVVTLCHFIANWENSSLLLCWFSFVSISIILCA